MKACQFSVQHNFPERNYITYQIICNKHFFFSELSLQCHWGLCQEVIVPEAVTVHQFFFILFIARVNGTVLLRTTGSEPWFGTSATALMAR